MLWKEPKILWHGRSVWTRYQMIIGYQITSRQMQLNPQQLMLIELSKGKSCYSKPLPICIALDQKIEKKYNACSSMNNLCTSIIYFTTSQVDSCQYLANCVSFQAHIFLYCFLRNQPLLIREIPILNFSIHIRHSLTACTTCTTRENYTIDSRFPLNSNLNWVTRISCIHELIMVDLLVNWLNTKVAPQCQTSYQIFLQLEIV